LLTHPTLDQMNALGLYGMAKAFGEIEASGDAATLNHAEWLALLLDRETTWRHERRLFARLRYANYASRLQWKTLITMLRAVSIVASFTNSAKANGSTITKI
jgi:hypothetical protein